MILRFEPSFIVNDRTINVVFFSDREMLPGLHVALRSLLVSGKTRPFRVHVFSDGLTKKDKDTIRATFDLIGAEATLSIVEYTPRFPPLTNSLHGNRTTYGRLYIADLLPEFESCIYVDSDVLICADVAGILDQITGELLLAADGGGVRKHSLDHMLFQKAGLPMDGFCFNAGVLWMNLAMWRKTSALEKCDQVAAKYPGQFLSADQSLLNVTFHDQFESFGDKFNTKLTPAAEMPSIDEEAIFHFVGSPKPWDLGGAMLHRSYAFWIKEYNKTAIGTIRPSKFTSWNRRIRIANSLYSVSKKRFKKWVSGVKMKRI